MTEQVATGAVGQALLFGAAAFRGEHHDKCSRNLPKGVIDDLKGG